MLYSSDLELGETTKRIFEAFERIKPARVVLEAGAAYARPAGVRHDVMNGGEAPMSFVEVEHKG